MGGFRCRVIQVRPHVLVLLVLVLLVDITVFFLVMCLFHLIWFILHVALLKKENTILLKSKPFICFQGTTLLLISFLL